MTDEDSESDGFDWDLQSSTVRAGRKIPIPESFRDLVCMDSPNSEPATWWVYYTFRGYALLSSDHVNGDSYITAKNRSYKLESGSRVTVPKPKSDEIDGGVLGSEGVAEGDTVYFYMDERMERANPSSAFVLSRDQFEKILDEGRTEIRAMQSGGADEVEGQQDGTEKKWETPKEEMSHYYSEIVLKHLFPVPDN